MRWLERGRAAAWRAFLDMQAQLERAAGPRDAGRRGPVERRLRRAGAVERARRTAGARARARPRAAVGEEPAVPPAHPHAGSAGLIERSNCERGPARVVRRAHRRPAGTPSRRPRRCHVAVGAPLPVRRPGRRRRSTPCGDICPGTVQARSAQPCAQTARPAAAPDPAADRRPRAPFLGPRCERCAREFAGRADGPVRTPSAGGMVRP